VFERLWGEIRFSKEHDDPANAPGQNRGTVMMRILIIEDEKHLAWLVAEVLGKEGYAAC
jgi:hypothetical protein